MKKIILFCILVLAILVSIGVVIVSTHTESYAPSQDIPLKQIEKSRVVSGNRINVFAGIFNNITIDVVIPESPHTMRIYKGYFRSGDLVENITGSMKEIKNPVPEDVAPEVARKILESQFGGLPEDAQLLDSAISYAEIHNRSTNEIIKKIPEETYVSWWRTVEGLRIEGGSDTIQVELGENGSVLRVYKRWRTYESLGNVSIISAEKAIDKLAAGDVLNLPSEYPEDVSIYNIHLGYYVDGIDNPEVTLEPIWVFYGNTSSGNYIPLFVYARQFANFTATPTIGKNPFVVAFTDTSETSPSKWYWDFGDGTNATDRNPEHTYTRAGTFNVTLKAWNDLGSDTMTKVAFVKVRNPAPPVANFTGAPLTGTVPLHVTFNDTSSGNPNGCLWDFGDGINATGQNPVHTYIVAGNYTVSLNVTNEDGSDSLTKTEYVCVNSIPPTTLTPVPTTIVTTATTAITSPPTTAVTTKPTPTGTHAPLSPLGVLIALAVTGLVIITRDQRRQ